MVHRTLVAALLVLAVTAGLPAPASAQQSISVQFGGFFPKAGSPAPRATCWSSTGSTSSSTSATSTGS